MSGSLLINQALNFKNVSVAAWNINVPGNSNNYVAIANSTQKIKRGQYVEFYHSLFDVLFPGISDNFLLGMYWLEGIDTLGSRHVYGGTWNKLNNGNFAAFADNFLSSRNANQGSTAFKRRINRTQQNRIEILLPSTQAVFYSTPCLVEGDMTFYYSSPIPSANLEKCIIGNL